MGLSMNVSGVQEEGDEEVVDPEFDEKIQGHPIPKIDWSRKGDDSIQSRTFNVIRRIDKWLKDHRFKQNLVPALKDNKFGRTGAASQTSLPSSNVVVDIASERKQRMEKTKNTSLGESFMGLASAHVTRSHSRKSNQKTLASSLVVELDSKEETQETMDAQMQDQPLLDVVDSGKEIMQLEDFGNTMVVVTSNQQSPLPKETSTTPKWLSGSLTKKRNVIPISIPMEDMVSKCLGRTSKSKRLKTKTMIDVDEQTGHWVVEVARPPADKETENATEKDFIIEKIDLGTTSRVADVKHLESSTKRILTMT